MRVLFDNDVVLDLILEREPFVADAAALFALHEQGRISGYVAAITPINVFYVTRKAKGLDVARRTVEELLNSLDVCPLDKPTMGTAHKLSFTDFEDAVQHASAEAAGPDAIVTRNVDDYKNAMLPVFTPADFLLHLKSQKP
jgi:predicted nucleic acid-binding protein